MTVPRRPATFIRAALRLQTFDANADAKTKQKRAGENEMEKERESEREIDRSCARAAWGRSDKAGLSSLIASQENEKPIKKSSHAATVCGLCKQALKYMSMHACVHVYTCLYTRSAYILYIHMYLQIGFVFLCLHYITSFAFWWNTKLNFF